MGGNLTTPLFDKEDDNDALNKEQEIITIERSKTEMALCFAYSCKNTTIPYHTLYQLQLFLQTLTTFAFWKEHIETKYIAYENCYSTGSNYYETAHPDFFRNYPSYLCDVMCSGLRLPCARQTIKFNDLNYTVVKQIEHDALFLINHMPETLLSTAGTLRCRDLVSPFTLSLYNCEINVDILEAMIEKTIEKFGIEMMKKTLMLILTNRPTDIFKDNEDLKHSEKYKKVLLILSKHNIVSV